MRKVKSYNQFNCNESKLISFDEIKDIVEVEYESTNIDVLVKESPIFILRKDEFIMDQTFDSPNITKLFDELDETDEEDDSSIHNSFDLNSKIYLEVKKENAPIFKKIEDKYGIYLEIIDYFVRRSTNSIDVHVRIKQIKPV
jgi:hypothetical protein